MVSTLGTGFNVLVKTPKIKVEGNNIKIIGKSSAKIIVDNRLVELSGESLNNYLKSIPSDEVRSIEIITNPSYQYDSELNSGLISIVF